MNQVLGYAGKRVIVTGCFSGMGAATARILLDLGAEVHGLDYKEATLPLASFTNVDLRDPASASWAGSPNQVDLSMMMARAGAEPQPAA